MVDGTSAREFSDAEAFERRDDHDEAAPAARERVAPRLPPGPAPASPSAIPASAPASPVAPAAPVEPPPRAKRRVLRPLLFALLPVALVVGGYDYVTGGQVMSTDNAYVQARSLGVSTDVSGTVAAIEVHDNQHVEKGQVLFRLKPDSFRIALEGAEAQLGTVRNQVLTLQASYKQSLSQIAQAQADVPFYQATFKRQQDLLSNNYASKAAFDQAEHDVTATQQRVAVAQSQAQSMLAQLGNDADQPAERNPFYLQAESAVDEARRDLADTVVRAPFPGVVTNVDALQVGAYLKASQAGFSLISDREIWIEASPKETELTYVKPGQAATVTVDTYPDVAWHGTVESISPASGSSFSLLPAQNTTGNWVKVVQRIPMRVRVALDPDKPPLRVGMSAVVDVETGHARGVPTSIQHAVDWARAEVAALRERFHV
ncbi:HlyD family secretion protein [Lichenibacterium ramalinae]|uniref:HlyD family secretion protein n=1 Tax=Lichenibacterium ramalinae TaxID=2316527 RepID=A0A4Q2R8C3_9HYPH|nr:HlyD family secretion protein [Lichenibacterium ramalinae]RYB02291.1 HlyD family secretion protein [Lichenibacterium ramalinae]